MYLQLGSSRQDPFADDKIIACTSVADGSLNLENDASVTNSAGRMLDNDR